MPDRQTLRYVKTSTRATSPIRGTRVSAGIDLTSAESVNVGPFGDRVLVSTDLKISLPYGTYGRLASRSSLSLNHGIEVGAGVIDPDYSGIIKILVYNHGDRDFRIHQGQKIAQLICEKITVPVMQAVDSIEVSNSRGEAGFGSTGW